MTAKPPLSIERRIAALHQEMERAIREYIAEIAPYYPGVTRDVIRHCELTARGWVPVQGVHHPSRPKATGMTPSIAGRTPPEPLRSPLVRSPAKLGYCCPHRCPEPQRPPHSPTQPVDLTTHHRIETTLL